MQLDKPQKKTTSYYEKLEAVFKEYEESLDLEIALAIIPLSDDERKMLEADSELQARILVHDARERKSLMSKLRGLTDAENEGVRFSAVKELGKTLYPKRFRQEPIDVNLKQQVYKIIGRDGEVVET